MTKRKRYSPEYKQEAIELVRRSGSSYRQIALDLGINPNLLTRWVREAKKPIRVATRLSRAPAIYATRRWPASSANWRASLENGIF